MLLLLPVQTPGFGSFAKDTPPEVLAPARMTYSGTSSQQQVYVCDPAYDKWNPGPAGYEGEFSSFGGLVQCYSEPYWYQSEGTWYQWCYTDELCYDWDNPTDRTISNRVDPCEATCGITGGRISQWTTDCYGEDYPSWCWAKAQPMWTAAEPTECTYECDQAAGSGTPGAVTCSTGDDSDCDASAKPNAKECPPTIPCTNDWATSHCTADSSDPSCLVQCKPWLDEWQDVVHCVCGQTGWDYESENEYGAPYPLWFVCPGEDQCCDGYGNDVDGAIVKCSHSGCGGLRRRNNGVIEATGWNADVVVD